MAQAKSTGDLRVRLLALAVAALGLALAVYVEFALTSASAQDRFGWFVYKAEVWLLLLLFVGPFLPVGRSALVGALLALGREALAFHRVFVSAEGDAAAISLWKPLAQLALIAAAWLAGFLIYLRAQREGAGG